MPFCRAVLAVVVALVVPQLSTVAQAGLILVDFGAGGDQSLPYTEDGFTFTSVIGNSTIPINATDRRLNLSGTGNVAVRITSAVPFDLQSFDMETRAARAWTVSSSGGGAFSIAHGTTAQTFDFSSSSGWKNLAWVDLSHTYDGVGNANLQVDNFRFNSPSSEAVPEPSSIALAAVVAGGLLLARRRRSAARTDAD